MSQEKELYYKGIYPVEIVFEADSVDRREVKVKVKHRFLLTSNYSDETRWIKPGEVLKVPAKLVWKHQREVAKGSLR